MKNKTQLFIDVRSRTHIIPFWIGKRDQEIISLIEKNIKDNAIVLDVGANIGYYTIPLALNLQSKNVKVYAFEPVTSNYNSLMKGVIKNGVEKNVIANKIALGDKEGSLEIIKTEQGNSGNAVLSINNDNFKIESERETIQMITLDQYMLKNNLERCDFIKIDIEGAEIFFIQGAIELIKKYKPIIYGEFNSYFIKKFGFSIMDVWNLLEPLGYSAYAEDHVHKAKFNKVTMKIGLENLLFLPKEADENDSWLNK
ncbi:MAG: FkbM family methyltransferase [Vicingus serpentipes]|nr:FkbM family methyltransferase [Vicingus serpentipes]